MPSSRRSVRIRAPSASSAAAGSDGCAEAQKSFAKKACSRCCPPGRGRCRRRAAGRGSCSRQYQQRVAWSRLPPIVPMFRSCGDAARRHASRSASGDLGRRLQLGQRRAGADRPPGDPARHGRAHVDERLGLDDPVAQQRHELGAARECACRPPARRPRPPTTQAAPAATRSFSRSRLGLAQRAQDLLARDRQRGDVGAGGVADRVRDRGRRSGRSAARRAPSSRGSSGARRARRRGRRRSRARPRSSAACRRRASSSARCPCAGRRGGAPRTCARAPG